MSRLFSRHPEIEVETAEGLPAVVIWRSERYEVELQDMWRVDSFWWQDEPIKRDYYLVDSPDLLCVVFVDRNKGSWHMHRIYD